MIRTALRYAGSLGPFSALDERFDVAEEGWVVARKNEDQGDGDHDIFAEIRAFHG